MFALLRSFVTVAAMVVGMVWLGQRVVLFPASVLPPESWPEGAEPIELSLASGGKGEALLVAPAATGDRRLPLIIFTHGNGELADQWVEEFAPVLDWGWAALLVEYPGYGRSAGSPSQASIFEVEEAAYRWSRSDPRIDPERIVAHGRSLGGGPAAWLAANHPVAGLILESTFTSVRPLAAAWLLPGFFVRDPFDNLAALEGYRGPLLVLHGRHDPLIPVSHGRELAAAVPAAEFHELECGHNDCPRQWTTIRRFLERAAKD